MIAEILFWICLVLMAHTYIVYPLVVALLRPGPGQRPDCGGRAGTGTTGREALPRVSVLIAVYNEEQAIRDRITNLRELDYPPENIEILIGSDASTDRTNEILMGAEAPGFRVYRFGRRRGKASILNDLMKEAGGEIIVLTDGNTVFHSDTVRELVRCFSDPAVGAVTGELVLESRQKNVGGQGEVSYWSFENWLKEAESDIGTTLGATGGVYAIRKELYHSLPQDRAVMDDFLIPMNILKEGRVVRYNRAALAREKAAGSIAGEFRRKVRIGAANLNGIREFTALLHPRHGFVAFALWSHKMVRWFVPFLLLVILAATASLANASEFFSWLFRLELVFLVMAAFGLAAERFRWQVGVFGYPYYFLAMNAALLLGFFKFLFRRQSAVWEIVRE